MKNKIGVEELCVPGHAQVGLVALGLVRASLYDDREMVRAIAGAFTCDYMFTSLMDMAMNLAFGTDSPATFLEAAADRVVPPGPQKHAEHAEQMLVSMTRSVSRAIAQADNQGGHLAPTWNPLRLGAVANAGAVGLAGCALLVTFTAAELYQDALATVDRTETVDMLTNMHASLLEQTAEEYPT